jgi:hypothetical protein
MNKIVSVDTSLIAACGLYCASCKRFQADKCHGCAGYEKATWCKIRACCLEKEIANCSACTEFIHLKDCKKFNNMLGRTIEFFFGGDRAKSIEYIRENGADRYAVLMAAEKRMSLPRK